METSSSASAPSNNGPLNLVGEENVVNEQPPNIVQSDAPETKGRGTKRPSTSTTTDDSTGGVSKKSKKRSWLWDHFNEVIIDGKKRVGCRYYTSNVCGDSKSGTSVMKNHLDRCLEYPPNIIDKSQKHLALQSDPTTTDATDIHDRAFNQQDTRKALSKMIIIDERPFKMVEHEGFRLFMSVACPHFKIPSRWTVARDCVALYLEDKHKLKTYFSNFSSRICLTTDTWSSCQNLGYMCLTAHFVDHDWKLRNKIINFCPIVGHTGEIIGKAIENCMIEWGITTKVLTVTVDNATANNVGLDYLRERLRSWNGTVLEGKFLQMRCAAHILSLTVREGLKEADDSILRIRNAVRFVRSSPTRLLKFNACVKKEQIVSNRHLCLDVETRWNFTYLMLESALIYRKAFFKLENSDGGKFRSELNKSLGTPYWENVDNVNLLLYIAVILDPRRKMQYKLRGMVMETLTSLYAHYTSCRPINMSSPPPQVEVCADECENMDDWQELVESQFERDVSGEVTNDRKNDLDKYLDEAREVNSKNFDILDWWRKRQETYPIVSLMAKDVLAIPVSTVASESAFSTGGRILDQFRSSLSPKMVEGLVCTQDWLRSTSGPLLAEDYVEELEKIDKGNHHLHLILFTIFFFLFGFLFIYL
ncbi:hypothetical protein RND81_12G043100 [Saponaria officinalis]|uniref:HAT C-terminal dimerisation domain-containing protein n=1 Tax=Saponaria officinalis TaxID=3572 RepID=A0AAW1H5A1_SAPOF